MKQEYGLDVHLLYIEHSVNFDSKFFSFWQKYPF